MRVRITTTTTAAPTTTFVFLCCIGLTLAAGATAPANEANNTPPPMDAIDTPEVTESSDMTVQQTVPYNVDADDTDADADATASPYCAATLCELYNGTHVIGQLPHIGCRNNGSFAYACGTHPQLIAMNARRRQLILDLHNLARSRAASGQVPGYEPAARMPLLKWDTELANLAALHVKRCRFAHDSCRNTPQYPLSGQNIGYFWIGRNFKSHSRRMKSFIVSWFREFVDANQTFIDNYQPHPEGKKIGHFTMMMADRAHHVGCAAIRYREPAEPQNSKFLLTCNYDYTNIIGESVYRSGAMATQCAYKVSERFPALCDWQQPQYEYDDDNGAAAVAEGIAATTTELSAGGGDVNAVNTLDNDV